MIKLKRLLNEGPQKVGNVNAFGASQVFGKGKKVLGFVPDTPNAVATLIQDYPQAMEIKFKQGFVYKGENHKTIKKSDKVWKELEKRYLDTATKNAMKAGFSMNESNENSNEKEMIDGIVDMLNQVDDIRNRKEIALDRLKDFHKEGIKLNVKDFLNRIGLSSITERHKSTPNERISKYKERIKNLQDKISKATDKNSDAVKLQKNQVKVIQQTMNNFKQAQTLKKQKSVGGND